MREIGEGVQVEVAGDRLQIVIDLKRPGRTSRSGKTRVIATTNGNKAVVDSSTYVGLTLFRYEP